MNERKFIYLNIPGDTELKKNKKNFVRILFINVLWNLIECNRREMKHLSMRLILNSHSNVNNLEILQNFSMNFKLLGTREM